MKRKILVLFLIILISVLLNACASKNQTFYETQSYNMATIIMQKISGKNSKEAAKEVVEKLTDIESRMNANSNSGEIYNINNTAGSENFIPVSPDTYYLLEKAKFFHKISGSVFDISIGPIVKLWGINTNNARVPSDGEIKQSLKLVDLNSLELNADSRSVRLLKAGQQIDLGAIAKGYAGDQAINIYKKHGINSAYINLGGNVVVLGNKPDGSKWRVGIRNPRGSNDEYIGILKILDKAVVTSGDYERFFEKDNIRYHHILDPHTGYPSNSDLMSSTIVADSSTDADALSTITFILGLEKGLALVESFDNVGAIFVTKDKKVYITDNLVDDFIFDDESKEYDYVKKR